MPAILFYGDSNTYGYDPADLADNRYPEEERWTSILQRLLSDNWHVISQGMNGRRIPDIFRDGERLERLLRTLSDNDIFAVMLGTNDILLTMQPDASVAIRKMEEFIRFLNRHLRPDQILVIAPPLIGRQDIKDTFYQTCFRESRKINDGFRLLADQYGTRFADASGWGVELSFDLVHFSKEGHLRFAEEMSELLFKINDD